MEIRNCKKQRCHRPSPSRTTINPTVSVPKKPKMASPSPGGWEPTATHGNDFNFMAMTSSSNFTHCLQFTLWNQSTFLVINAKRKYIEKSRRARPPFIFAPICVSLLIRGDLCAHINLPTALRNWPSKIVGKNIGNV